jgi:hypothetical protein
MNYKVMQRPMFKMGGKAASQGTGITSGLDEKVNMAIGGGVIKGDNLGAREGFQSPDLSGMSIEDLVNLQQQNYDKSLSRIGDMRDIVKLQTLGNLATNVLPNIERGGFGGVVDFFQNPMTTQSAIKGLTGLKTVDLKEKELQGKGLDRLITGKLALEKLDIARDKAAVLTATQVKVNSGNEARQILRDNNVTNPNDLKDEILKDQYYELKNIADGTLTPSDATQIATRLVNASSIAQEKEKGYGYNAEEFKEAVDAMVSVLLGGNAEGGIPNRVKRQMGTPITGEQPMANPMAVEKKDVAMETQDQGNDAYAMLRARLPQEIPDDVVKLIAYNKEAFADFASIKNQEDVSSFNQKYGVSMNIDVSTV